MDFATIVGLILGVALLLAAVGSQVTLFVDMPSLFIVIGGATAACLIAMPLARLLNLGRIAKNAFFATKASMRGLTVDLVRFGEIARRDGILALEGVMDEISDPFLARGMQLAVDGNDPETISETLETEMEYLSGRHATGKKLFETIGKYAPAFGMIGTLIGLILMLANLDDPNSIAPNMAVALITTLYGALLANLVALPIADKLENRNQEELQRMSLIIAGVVAIQSGDNPKVVEQKLQIFLPPKERGQ